MAGSKNYMQQQEYQRGNTENQQQGGEQDGVGRNNQGYKILPVGLDVTLRCILVFGVVHTMIVNLRKASFSLSHPARVGSLVANLS